MSNTPIVVLTDLATSCWVLSFDAKSKTITKTPITTWQQLTQTFQDPSMLSGTNSGGGRGVGGRGGRGRGRGGGGRGEGRGGEGRGRGGGGGSSEGGSQKPKRQRDNKAPTNAEKVSRRPMFARELDLESVIEQALSLPVEEQKEYIYSVCLAYMT